MHIQRHTILVRTLIILAAILLSACGSAAAIAPTATLSPAPPTDTPAPPTITPCAFMWAYRDAPGVPERAQALLNAAAITTNAVRANLFGEACGDGFGVMATTIEIELPVTDISDQEALGDLTMRVANALATIGETPGGQHDLRLIFIAGEERTALNTTAAQAERAIANGLSGAALLEALGGPR